MSAGIHLSEILKSSQDDALIAKGQQAMFASFVQAIGTHIRTNYLKRQSDSRSAMRMASLFKQLCSPSDQIDVKVSKDGPLVIVTSVMPDHPFIVDTIHTTLRAEGAHNSTGFNSTVRVQRDEKNQLSSIGSGETISLVLVEADGLQDRDLNELQRKVQNNLRLARAMTQDFHAINETIDNIAMRCVRAADRQPEKAIRYREIADLLRWLLADNFVFMSMTFQDQRLGFANPESAGEWPLDDFLSWEPQLYAGSGRFRKSHHASPVHRASRLDELVIAIPASDNDHSLLRLQGLFTYRGSTQPNRYIPVLRRILGNQLQQLGFQVGGYQYKNYANLFDSLPTEVGLLLDGQQLKDMIEDVLEHQEARDTYTHITQIKNSEATFALISMAQRNWSNKLRKQIEMLLLKATNATHHNTEVTLGRNDCIYASMIFMGTHAMAAETVDAIQAQISDLTTPWEIRIHEALVEHYQSIDNENGPERADALLHEYRGAFGEAYRRYRPTEECVRDLQMLEELGESQPTLVDVFAVRGRVYLRVYQNQNINLSNLLPIIDNFGLVVQDQFVDEVASRTGGDKVIDTFRLAPAVNLTPDHLSDLGATLGRGIEVVLNGSMTSDPLNRILVPTGLSWQSVDMFRAYLGYARQLGLYYSDEQLPAILLTKPTLVQGLWDLFRARFDPDQEGKRDRAIQKANEHVQDALRSLNSRDQDLVFRTFYNLIQSTLRTNFYRTDRVFHYISFKIDCSTVTNMPSPRMMYEIYVHHPDMEGVHLRGGKVARGGIRWSDRTDFRREILDLVATQMVKNVLIVPVGAKGGFRMKHQITDRSLRRKRADELYQVLIRGMLDISDNIVKGEVTHPPRVVIHDQRDPYLVVAADKGTAHLSDTANGLSAEYGFWLGDAFASGGSNGYDHKKVGITARGGWVTAKRHFLEMGLNPYKEEFTTVGVGDTGGDVFGNGVIESPHMKLVGAFNHLHVFIDPNPDAEVSYKERKRLFKAVKGWDHYNPKKISKGGGIFSRHARSIPLSPEIQELLGVLKDELPVDVVIRLLLRLNVDLFWNGGIGTYVKAASEDHLDAGDPNNDRLRINSNELRAKIIGEGGNLGFTQQGRIDFALQGGRINTDALDNSGGVDMSDHEVNLKILLNPMVANGSLSLEDRNTLLERMTNEVADQVLHNSDVHGRQMSLDVLRSVDDPMSFSRTIDWACGRSGVSRADIKLPSDNELIRRSGQGKGLTRPELCVLAAHVKMHVFNDLTKGGTEEIPEFNERVLSYFPKEIQKTYPDAVGKHMLHKSIGMTVIANEIVGDAGAWFFPGISELTGATTTNIARAWLIAMKMIDARDLIKKLNKSEASFDARYRGWMAITQAVTGLVGLWLSPGEGIPDEESQKQTMQALGSLDKISATTHQERIRERAESHTELPKKLARRIALLGDLNTAVEIASINGEKLSLDSIAYLAIGEASKLQPTIKALEIHQSTGGWDPVAIAILRTRYLHLLRDLNANIRLGKEAKLGVDRVTLRLSRHHLAGLSQEMEEILSDNTDIAALLVAEQRIRARIQREFVNKDGLDGTGL